MCLNLWEIVIKYVGARFLAQYHTVGGILDQRAQYNEFVESGLKG